MDFFITGATYKLLILLYITQVICCVVKDTDYHSLKWFGRDVWAVDKSFRFGNCCGGTKRHPVLCCGGENDSTIIMLEWNKQQKETDQKIAVFHPHFPINYYKNFSTMETSHSETGKLLGSMLNLFKVTENDSGKYICEITSFPHGSSRATTKLEVTGYSVSLKSYPYEFVKEGDDVKITCLASPPPLDYKLQRSKDELFLLKSSNGEFVLPNITRDNSDRYVCFPQWNSPTQHQQRFNTTMDLTVNFLDSSECNASSPLKVPVGEDVTISCKANASQPLQYKWMKGNTTISRSDTLSLSSVNFNHSGRYRLTAAFQNSQLQTDIDFSIQVFTTEEFTTQTTSPSEGTFSTESPFLNQTTQHLRNFTSVDTSTWNTGVALTTTESPQFPTSTAQPNAPTITAGPGNSSHERLLNISSSDPPVGGASTLHPYIVNATSGWYTVKLSTTADPATRTKTVAFDTSLVLQNDSKRVTYIVIPVVLLVLMLIVLLYSRHLMLKRMDKPPPFKPPPPPVKYTSVRNHDVPMTDILI